MTAINPSRFNDLLFQCRKHSTWCLKLALKEIEEKGPLFFSAKRVVVRPTTGSFPQQLTHGLVSGTA